MNELDHWLRTGELNGRLTPATSKDGDAQRRSERDAATKGAPIGEAETPSRTQRGALVDERQGHRIVDRPLALVERDHATGETYRVKEKPMPEPEKSEHAKAVEELMTKGRELSQNEANAHLSEVVNRVESRLATDRMLQFFKYEHLPPHLQRVSAPFGKLAQEIVDNLPSNAERTVALRKLLESKDAAVRSVLYEG